MAKKKQKRITKSTYSKNENELMGYILLMVALSFSITNEWIRAILGIIYAFSALYYFMISKKQKK